MLLLGNYIMYFAGMNKRKNGVAVNYILQCGGITLWAVALRLASQGLWASDYGLKKGWGKHSP